MYSSKLNMLVLALANIIPSLNTQTHVVISAPMVSEVGAVG